MADEDRRTTVGELFAADDNITALDAAFEGSDTADKMLAFFTPRYEWAAKEFDRWHVDTQQVTVISIGTLYGATTAETSSRMSARWTSTMSEANK